MNAQPVFCCNDMLGMVMHGSNLVVSSIENGITLAIRGEGQWMTPLRYCPSCGKEFHLTFLTDSEVYR